jgi:hypothetical protein
LDGFEQMSGTIYLTFLKITHFGSLTRNNSISKDKGSEGDKRYVVTNGFAKWTGYKV